MIDSAKVEPEENVPPSVVDSDAIVEPFGDSISMSRIITVDQSTPAFDDPSDELVFPILIRDSNVHQTLEYRITVDRPRVGSLRIILGSVPGLGTFERDLTVRVPLSELPFTSTVPVPTRVGCHRIELFVSSEFELNNSINPVTPGDVDSGVWWVRVVDSATQQVDLATCPP